MASILPILFLFIVCCCCFSFAGGVYYLWTSNTSTDATSGSTSSPPEIETPLPEKLSSITAAQCQSVSAINKTAITTCTDGRSESGFTWNWGTDDISQACKDATKYYEVTATSSYLPNVTLKQTITGGAQNTAGIKKMLPEWHQTNVTFTVMPLNENKEKLMLYPVSVPITQATDNQSCKTAGVNAITPVPAWNENKNLIDVGVKSTNGAAGGIAVIDTRNESEAFFSGYGGGIGWDNRMVVPEGFRAQSWCQDTGGPCGRVKEHPWDELKTKQVDGKVNYSGDCWANCPSGGL